MKLLAVILLILQLFVYGCKSYHGNRKYADRKNKDCNPQIFLALPQDRNSFVKLGTCTGRGAVLIKDGSEKAFNRVVKCACKHGGNAIVLTDMKATGFEAENAAGYNYLTNTGSLYTAIVIKMK